MLFSVTGATLAASVQTEGGFIVDDAKELLREIIALFEWISAYRLLDVPMDRVLHFLVAAALFLIVVRFMARWKALLVTLIPMLLKEAVDIPAKLRFLQEGQPLDITMDSVWDMVAGLAGLGVGLLVATALGDRWRAWAPKARGQLLPALHEAEAHRGAPRVAFGALFGISVAIVVGFQVVPLVTGTSYVFWVPHVIAVGAVVAASAVFGTANTLLFLVPALPFANWIHRSVSNDRLNVVNTLILTLLCCEILRRLKDRRRSVRFGKADWLVLVYSVYACVIVVVNCFRLGWSLERAYWLIPPFTGLAVYLLARNLLTDDRILRRALLVFAAAVLLVCGIGIVEFLTVRPMKLEAIPGALFGEAPLFSVYLALVWPFVAALALSFRARPRVVYWLCTVAGAVAVVLVFVRSCWAAAGCALVLLVVLFLLRRDWALGLGVALAVAAGGGMLAWSARQVMANPKSEFKSRLVAEVCSVLEPDSYRTYRGSVVDRAEEILAASPLLGSTGQSAHTLHHAHAISYGIPGTVLAATAILAVLAYGWLGVLRSRDALVFAVAAGATAVFLAAILEGLGWSTLRRSSMQPLLWYMLGLVPASLGAAWSRAVDAPAPVRPTVPGQAPAPRAAHVGYAPGRSDPRRWVMLAVAIASIVVIVVLLWLMSR